VAPASALHRATGAGSRRTTCMRKYRRHCGTAGRCLVQHSPSAAVQRALHTPASPPAARRLSYHAVVGATRSQVFRLKVVSRACWVLNQGQTTRPGTRDSAAPVPPGQYQKRWQISGADPGTHLAQNRPGQAQARRTNCRWALHAASPTPGRGTSVSGLFWGG
jgi:hypothetical protein